MPPVPPRPLQVVAGALLLGGYQGLRYSGREADIKAQLLLEEVQSSGGVSHAQEQQALWNHCLL